jgi:preprotein translocase subunit SecE
VLDKLKLLGAALVVVAGVAGFYVLGDASPLLKAGIVIVSIVAAAAITLTSEPGQAAWQFALGARAEVRKVVWPTQRETLQSTLVVIVMVLLVGIYLWLLDAVAFWAVYDLLLGVSGR